ncbi:DUF308 domain-containing protein [Roseibacillus persicicus]|uniref:DUF308 domain-containing protein n=1 Tax=Roseibacillus persicicus TaxID=454148 RepID=UPI00280D7760|nr:DUF308 domain-containing protein [Roseibacillus persicicus]MDQ8189417.1 DUF308 domain-containing protein [Roseibacillus persicicus]
MSPAHHYSHDSEMTRQEEATDRVNQLVFEGKELEAIEREFAHSRLHGALSADDLAFEYYRARTAYQIAKPKNGTKKAARFVGVLAITGGLIAIVLTFAGDDADDGLRRGPIIFGIASIILGGRLLHHPEKAFEKVDQ